jgi:hypothetical protein
MQTDLDSCDEPHHQKVIDDGDLSQEYEAEEDNGDFDTDVGRHPEQPPAFGPKFEEDALDIETGNARDAPPELNENIEREVARILDRG